MSGPGGGLFLNCTQFDTDDDGDVDLLDFAEFSIAFDGGA
jgi:hypothetical protein